MLAEVVLLGFVGLHAGLHLDRQVAAVVDQLAPQLPPFPPPIVGRVGAKDQQHAEHQAQQGVKRGMDVDPVAERQLVEHHDRRRIDAQQADGQRNAAEDRALCGTGSGLSARA